MNDFPVYCSIGIDKCQVFFGKFCEYTILDIFFLAFRAHLSITYPSNRVIDEQNRQDPFLSFFYFSDETNSFPRRFIIAALCSKSE